MQNLSNPNHKIAWLLVGVFGLLYPSIEATMPKCDATLDKAKSREFDMRPSSFKFKQGAVLKGKIMASYFRPNSSNATCKLNCEFFLKKVDPAKYQLFYLKLGCSGPMKFVFSKTNSTLWKSVILYLDFDGPCIVSVHDLAAWGDSADLIVLYLINTELLENNKTSDRELIKISQIGTIILRYSKMRGIPALFTRRVWQNIAEMDLIRIEVQRSLRELKYTLPNLQSLNIQFSGLTRPPDFPWTSKTLLLPRNLSRTDSFNQHYQINDETTVQPDSYRRFLILDNNNITDLSNFTFQGFLSKISLKGNGLKEIGSTCFHGLKKIQTIDLSKNILSKIPPLLFQNLFSLLQIHLDQNKISILYPNTFKDLQSLTHIFLQNNTLKTLPKNLMTHLKNLEVVHLEYNRIESIEDGAFPEQSLRIREIYLSSNYIKRFPPWMYLLRNIQTIDLSKNFITFDEFLSKPLDSFELTILLNQHRKTSSSTDLEFRQGWEIKLNLAGNKIRELSLDGFTQSKKEKLMIILKVFRIDLSENPIFCDCKTFQMAKFLHEAIRRQPSAMQITTDKFNTWICAKPDDLKVSALLTVGQREFKCERNITNCPKECKCSIRVFDSTVFVECSGRNLTRMPEELPHGLLELHFEKNAIEELPPKEYLKNTIALYLTDNSLFTLNASAVQKMKQVRELFLDNNKLTSLPLEIQELNFTKIALHRNRLLCDCRALWIKQWLLNVTNKIINVKQIVCSSGKSFGLPIIETPAADFVCEQTDDRKSNNGAEHLTVTTALYVVIPILIVCFCFLIFGFLYRVEIKLFLFSRFHWHPFDSVDDSDPDKIYDAFVSYNSHDETWVYETLRDTLENCEPPYRLCLHERDFEIGASIQENIFHSVQRSKRMIMVLSQHFIQSEWCMLEFRAAHHKVLQDRRRYLIIILMDDVRMSELDDELKLYMRTNTYLSVKNKWFWEKLLYALPPKTLSRPERNSTNPTQLTVNVSSLTILKEEEGSTVETTKF